jgi:hypothetical protein
MSVLAKIFIVIQTILVMVYLGMTATLYQHRRDWRTSYLKLKDRYGTAVSRAQKEIKALQSYVHAKDSLIQSKEREVRSLKAQLDQSLSAAQQNSRLFEQKRAEFQQQLTNNENLSRRNEAVHTRNEQLSRENDRLQEEYDSATTRREIAENQVARLIVLTQSLETDVGELRRDFAETRRQLREKELLISMAEGAGVNFELLVPGPPVPSIYSRVVAVKNDIDPPLVLLRVGSDEGVERGFHFSIYRGNQFVGKVIVERVLRDSVGCRVLFTAEGQSINIGDDAATRLGE